jgi:hypothetical protein
MGHLGVIEMTTEDIVAIGHLMMSAVVLGALLAAGGPVIAKALVELLSRWLK